MSGVAGVEIKAAIKKAATWGTPVAAGLHDGILILPTSVKKSAGNDVDDSLGTFIPVDGNPGEIKVEGDIPMYLRYDGLDLLLALFLGTAGDPAQQGGTTAYAYLYKWLMSVDGLFMTYVKNMKNYIEENASAKVVGLTIKGETGKALQLIVKTICQNKVFDSVINTTSTFNNVTIFESANRVRFSEGVFRMNDKDGAALSDADKIYPSSFELSAQRKMRGVYGQYKTAAPNVQDLIDEPTNDGTPTVTLKLTFPRHSNTTYLSVLGSDTRKKMDITFTGRLIAAPYYRTFKIQMPHLQMTGDDPADAMGIITEPLDFNVLGTLSAPAGMAALTDPFWISGVNRLATNPLTGSQPAMASPSASPSQSVSASPSVSVSSSPSSSPSASASSSPSAS